MMDRRGMRYTTELRAPLKERGFEPSRENLYRIVTGAVPARTEMIGALCDVLACAPNDLIDVERPQPLHVEPPSRRPRRATKAKASVAGKPPLGRIRDDFEPVPARVRSL